MPRVVIPTAIQKECIPTRGSVLQMICREWQDLKNKFQVKFIISLTSEFFLHDNPYPH